MASFKYNPNNTEGKYPTALEVRDTELKKDDKAVATDLVDLYDVEITNPQEGNALYYDEPSQLWKNGEGAGSGSCSQAMGYIYIVDYPNNPPGNGSFNDPFTSIDYAFDYLRKCRYPIYGTAIATKYSDQRFILTKNISLNYYYGEFVYLKYVKFKLNIIRDGSEIRPEYYAHINGTHNLHLYNVYTEITFNLPEENQNISYIKPLQLSGGSYHTDLLVENHDTPIDTRSIWVTGSIADKNFTSYTRVSQYREWKQISSGTFHIVAIDEKNRLWGYGSNQSGQLGLGKENSYYHTDYLIPLSEDTDWSYVVCGGAYTFAVKEDGTLWATGQNEEGQLGLGESESFDTNIYKFTQVDGVIVSGNKIYTGRYSSYYIDENNNLFGTGNNYYGQLGLGDNNYREYFTFIRNNVLLVESGYYHIFIFYDDGNGKVLAGSGRNINGQLGLGDSTDKNVFTDVPIDIETTSYYEISAGYDHTMLKLDNKMYGTGKYSEGQLGFDAIGTFFNFTDITTYHTYTNNFFCGLQYTFGYHNINSSALYAFGTNTDYTIGLPQEKLYKEPTYSFGGVKKDGIFYQYQDLSIQPRHITFSPLRISGQSCVIAMFLGITKTYTYLDETYNILDVVTSYPISIENGATLIIEDSVNRYALVDNATLILEDSVDDFKGCAINGSIVIQKKDIIPYSMMDGIVKSSKYITNYDE
jgi:alpha-tubulin suppressor-like RCC1 family protein